MLRRALRIGIVGHRQLEPEAARFAAVQCAAILRGHAGGGGRAAALSAIAEGADTLFAQAALRLGVPLEIVIPFEQYAADFETSATQAAYQALRSSARRVTRLPFVRRSDRAYEAAMRWIVRRSDVLVAVWDGRPARGRGGTAAAIERAQRAGRYWIHVDIDRGSIASHGRRPPRLPAAGGAR